MKPLIAELLKPEIAQTLPKPPHENFYPTPNPEHLNHSNDYDTTNMIMKRGEQVIRGKREVGEMSEISSAENMIVIGKNVWYQWAEYTAKTTKPGKGCYVCSMAQEEQIVIPVPWRSEDGPEHIWRHAFKEEHPSCPFECMLLVGSSYHRERTAIWMPGEGKHRHTIPKHTVLELCKRNSHPWMRTDPGQIMDYTLGIGFKFECFDLTARAGKGVENLGVFEGTCNRTWVLNLAMRGEFMLKETPVPRCSKEGKQCSRKDRYVDRYLDFDFARHILRSPMDIPLADLWWACGKEWGLRNTLPTVKWSGKCARVTMMQRAMVMAWDNGEIGGASENGTQHKTARRNRRATKGSEQGEEETQAEFNYGGYLDAIGQPRGIPERYKARNEVLSGFESIFPQIAINKNTEWINYIYYNQQRFINYTTDALRALGEQLDATSRMAMQNRMVDNWMLAKEGGVCAKFGSFCCTYIPNNTAPNGEFTKAMNRLTRLQDELADNAGRNAVDSTLTEWFQTWFGASWGGWLRRAAFIAVISLIVIALILCCVIPCLKALAVRAVTSQVSQMPLLLDMSDDTMDSVAEPVCLKEDPELCILEMEYLMGVLALLEAEQSVEPWVDGETPPLPDMPSQ